MVMVPAKVELDCALQLSNLERVILGYGVEEVFLCLIQVVDVSLFVYYSVFT